MANFYWMAVTALTWNTTSSSNRWSNAPNGGFITTTGPTASDDVFFDAYSPANCVVGSGTYACRSINFTGFTRTFNHSVGTINVGDGTAGASNVAIKLATGMTYTVGGTLNFISTSTTQQSITCAGKTLPITNFSGVGSSYILADAFKSTGVLTINNGTFDTSSNNYAVTAGTFNSSNTNVRTIKFNGSTITLSFTGSPFWNMTTTTGLTNPTTAFSGCTINSTSNIYSTSAFYGGGLNYGYIFPGYAFGGTGLSMYGNNTIYYFAVTTPSGGGVGGIYFEAGSTTTFGSTVSIPNAGTVLVPLQSTSAGSTFTLKGSQQTFAGTYLDVKDCIGAGETKWFASNSTNSGHNTNWRFNVPMYGAQSLLGCGI